MTDGQITMEDIRKVQESLRQVRAVFRPIVSVSILHYTGEQRRRHRRKRINKKWLKRYGCFSGPLPRKDYWLIWEGSVYTTWPMYQKIRREMSVDRKRNASENDRSDSVLKEVQDA